MSRDDRVLKGTRVLGVVIAPFLLVAFALLWLREYYAVRVPVWVHVERLTSWPDLRCAGGDGFPIVVPVDVESEGDDGLGLSAATALAPGARRAGMLGHAYRPQLIGLESRAYTGWLEVGEDGRALYAPHTEAGYRAPASKTGLLLLNGLLAKRGVRQARRRR